MAKINLTAELLRANLAYNPDTGVFTRLIRSCNSVNVGDVAGNISHYGYIVISVGGAQYPAHRLAWLHTYGVIPSGEVDHLNGIRTDNRIVNLRDVSKTINCQNLHKARSDNSLGLLGVSKNGNRFRANIMAYGRNHFIGNYPTPEMAHEAYIEAKRRLHDGCLI